MTPSLKLSVLAVTLLAASGCVRYPYGYRDYPNATLGAATGALVGGVLGHQLDHDDGTLAGAAAGAVIGGTLGYNADRAARYRYRNGGGSYHGARGDDDYGYYGRAQGYPDGGRYDRRYRQDYWY